MEQPVKARVLSLRPKAPAIECSRTVRRQGRLVGTNAPSVRVGDRGGTEYVPDGYPPSEQRVVRRLTIDEGRGRPSSNIGTSTPALAVELLSLL
jgi:hypothetical protein